jgi:hypothetical protein
MGNVFSPSISFRITIGLLVTGSTVSPDISMGMSIVSSKHYALHVFSRHVCIVKYEYRFVNLTFLRSSIPYNPLAISALHANRKWPATITPGLCQAFSASCLFGPFSPCKDKAFEYTIYHYTVNESLE